MPRPGRHHCPGLRLVHNHPRWSVVKGHSAWWWSVPPNERTSTSALVTRFTTHADAMTYATTRARAVLYDAIQNQPQEVTC